MVSNVSQKPQPVKVREPTTAPIGTKDIDIKHKALLLGSGSVSAPVVDYLMRDQSIRLTVGKQRRMIMHALAYLVYNDQDSAVIVFQTILVFLILASAETEEAEALSEVFANTSSVSVDVETEKEKLQNLIKDHELVIRYIFI